MTLSPSGRLVDALDESFADLSDTHSEQRKSDRSNKRSSARRLDTELTRLDTVGTCDSDRRVVIDELLEVSKVGLQAAVKPLLSRSTAGKLEMVCDFFAPPEFSRALRRKRRRRKAFVTPSKGRILTAADQSDAGRVGIFP